MQWTLVKHIVSERVCKWNRPIPGAGKSGLADKRANLVFFPDLLLLPVMGGLLLLALVRSSFPPAELLVAWGDDGALPAVCYSSCSSAGLRQYTVLCPGGSNAASQLLFALDRRGCARLECIFASTVSSAPRGVRVMLKKKKTAQLILSVDNRFRKSGTDLAAEARSAGIAVRELHPAPGGQSSRHQYWEFRSWKGKNGDLHWSFLQLREQVQITLAWKKNGILQLEYQDTHAKKITKQFPRNNRYGIWTNSPKE